MLMGSSSQTKFLVATRARTLLHQKSNRVPMVLCALPLVSPSLALLCSRLSTLFAEQR